MALLRDKRLLLVGVLIGGIAATFWASSRIPSLEGKAAVGRELALEDPLGFEPVVRIEPEAPFLEKVAYTTVNWIHTNRQGMAFGLVLAAAFMTLLPLLQRAALGGVFSNTLLGVVVGAPLGVCVNCAAPIARGLHASGARIETSLATMISSPTLNIVVVTMVFTLFPFYLAVIKVGLSLFFLLVMIPVLSVWLFHKEQASPASLADLAAPRGPTRGGVPLFDEPARISWNEALGWVVRNYATNLWFIVRNTVPLMLLAGVLGAAVVTLLPWDQISSIFPESGHLGILAGMGVLSFVGLFLPVPIAFDVVVSAALLAGGLPVKYVAVLLFTLGIFSVYSFLIVWKAMSWRVATVLASALIVLGMAAGLGSHLYWRWDVPRQRAVFYRAFSEAAPPPVAQIVLPEGVDQETLVESLQRAALPWSVTAVAGDAGIRVERRAFEPREPGGGKGFERLYGDRLGLERVDHLSVAFKFTPPFQRDFPIAAADVHRDGWVDVLVGSDRGLYLYASRGGREFVLQRLEIPELASLYVANLALVDLDEDGWLDIFLSAYRAGNFVIYGDRGRFRAERFERLPDTGANVANAVAFGDLDRDGDLDIVLGNWTLGRWMRVPARTSQNAILWNESGSFRVEKLPGISGDTLSTLLSDINLDGRLDLLVGNDHEPPDFIYLGRGSREFERLTPEDGLVPHSTSSTMSIDSADIDNDLRPEIYFAQISGDAPSQRGRLERRPAASVCDDYADDTWRVRCQRNMAVHAVLLDSINGRDARECLALPDPHQRGDCIAYQMLIHATSATTRDLGLCDHFPARWESFAFICHSAFAEPALTLSDARRRAIPQILRRNVLLVPGEDGAFVDRAEQLGVDVAGWTWNAKFADLDNDEWQDLYAVNGNYRLDRRQPNVLFLNEQGRRFRVAGEEMGLGSFLSTGSYSYADVDNDGDLDVVEIPFDGPIWLYRNQLGANHALIFELADEIGNSHGIGSRVVIHYGPGAARHQMREIKASGGYLSFDPAEAHFGLGGHERVERVEIFWSSGGQSELRGPFAAGHRYRVTRSAPRPPVPTGARAARR